MCMPSTQLYYCLEAYSTFFSCSCKSLIFGFSLGWRELEKVEGYHLSCIFVLVVGIGSVNPILICHHHYKQVGDKVEKLSRSFFQTGQGEILLLTSTCIRIPRGRLALRKRTITDGNWAQLFWEVLYCRQLDLFTVFRPHI